MPNLVIRKPSVVHVDVMLVKVMIIPNLVVRRPIIIQAPRHTSEDRGNTKPGHKQTRRRPRKTYQLKSWPYQTYSQGTKCCLGIDHTLKALAIPNLAVRRQLCQELEFIDRFRQVITRSWHHLMTNLLPAKTIFSDNHR
jgi:hypothetical protein